MSGGKIKKTSYVGGYGYCGWHTTWNNKRVYLRSMLEKVYALYLDEQKVYYLTEKQSYQIGKSTYKPDFFIYDDNKYIKLIKIVEIKGSKKIKIEFETKYTSFFNAIGIEYEVKNVDDRTYRKKYKKETDEFIENSTSISMRGEFNPRYGIKFTEEQSKKMSIIQKEIQNRPEVKKKKIDANKKWHVENKELFLQIVKKREGKKRKIKEQKLIDTYGVLCVRSCVFCSANFNVRSLSKRNHCHSYSCVIAYKKQQGFVFPKKLEEHKIKQMKSMLLNRGRDYLKYFTVFTDENIWEYKKLVHKHQLPFSIKCICKYFTNIETFEKELTDAN